MGKTIKKYGLAALFLAALAACQGTPGGKTSAEKGPKKIVVWTFTKEMNELLEIYKKSPRYDDSKVSLSIVLTKADGFQAKLDSALQSGMEAPDVLTLEAAFLGKYVESGKLADLSEMASAYAKCFPYVVDAATDSGGKVRALSWHAAPGCFYYRRSLAKKYLGSDDPAAVQEKVGDFKAFMATAVSLARDSRGSARIVPSSADLFQVFKGARKTGWVRDGKLSIDPAMIESLGVSRRLHKEGLEADIGMWTEEWFQAMRSGVDAPSGEIDVLGYFLPTWGLEFVLKPYSMDRLGLSGTRGDWAMVPGPAPYFWGGTWVAARAKSANLREALEIVEYLGTDPECQKAWTGKKGDIASIMEVADEAKGGYADSFLGGQNYYAAFVDMARTVNGKTLSAYDSVIDGLWQAQQRAFAKGRMSEAAVLTEFRSAVKKAIPTLDVR
jgi:multiple sugar transport system substrate-binding protein